MTAESVLAAMTARAEAAWLDSRIPALAIPVMEDVPRLVDALRAVLALADPDSGMATNCWSRARHIDAADIVTAITAALEES